MAEKKCSIPGCERPAWTARSLCKAHYTRWWRYGDPLAGAAFKRTLPEPIIHGDYAEIPITQGKTALCDVEDLPLVQGRLWAAHPSGVRIFYARTKENKRMLFMHQLVMGELPDGWIVDHIDGDGLNNRRSNLRAIPRSFNVANQRKFRFTKNSPYKGVFRSKLRWGAKMSVGDKDVFLGQYRTPEEAARAYDRAAVARWGDVACTNEKVGLLTDAPLPRDNA